MPRRRHRNPLHPDENSPPPIPPYYRQIKPPVKPTLLPVGNHHHHGSNIQKAIIPPEVTTLKGLKDHERIALLVREKQLPYNRQEPVVLYCGKVLTNELHSDEMHQDLCFHDQSKETLRLGPHRVDSGEDPGQHPFNRHPLKGQPVIPEHQHLTPHLQQPHHPIILIHIVVTSITLQQTYHPTHGSLGPAQRRQDHLRTEQDLLLNFIIQRQRISTMPAMEVGAGQ